MHPFFSIFSIELPAFGIMMILGGCFGAILAILRCAKANISRQDTFLVFLFGAIGLIIGAKLLYTITDIGRLWEFRHLLWEDTGAYLNMILGGGLVFYGGLIGGIAAVFIYCKAFKTPFSFFEIMDLYAPSIALMHAIGRVGCFLAGCCYGMHIEGPFGVVFTNSLGAPNGVSLLPIQLIESGLNIILCAALMLYARKKRTPGRVIGLYLVVYAIMRFTLEFFRGDAIRGFILGLSTSQFISILVLPVGVLLLIRKSRKNKIDFDK